MNKKELTPIIKDSFIQFAGAVLQSRALVDVRDCIKPSARQIFYCMETDKFTHSKPFQKTLKAIGSAFRLYIHGDSSAEGVIMRAGQPFSMRYPLVEVEGSYGTLLASESWAAPRYTGARLSALSEYLFADLQKETIEEWRDNYDNTEKYPTVLPSKGYYNLVNGTFGLGVGASSSVPQYNLREMNEALITLLNNPDATFDDIYCAPDFATGAILYNEADIKESMKNGTGAACKLRSVVEWDSKDRCFVVTEIPYMVYTETICRELEEIINSEDNPGIERFNDLTGEKPLIKIYLLKKANPDKILKYLYKNTSLQSYFGVNFTMLDNGRFPRVFTWKKMLQAHIDHEKVVYRRGFEFDLRKIEARLHILDGLIKCCARIEEVVQTIKTASNPSFALQKNFELDELQAKAVLDMKLARIAHLEVEKLQHEYDDLQAESEHIKSILGNELLLNKEIENGLREVADKFGDGRRTKILNLTNEDGEEPTEIKQLQLSLTNKNNIYAVESSTLYTQRRGGVGAKAKLEKGEYVIDSVTAATNDILLFFSKSGNYYHLKATEVPIEQKMPLCALLKINDEEEIKTITPYIEKKNILFFTKNGVIKKSLLSEYNTTRAIVSRALSLDEGDEIVSILFTDEEPVGILTKNGNFIIIKTDDVRAIGRVTRGIQAIKLNPGDSVTAARIIKQSAKEIVSVSGAGYIKRTSIGEFSIQGKNTKGAKIQRLTDDDYMVDFLPINDLSEVTVAATASAIKISINEIPLLSRGAQGNKSIKLSEKSYVISLS